MSLGAETRILTGGAKCAGVEQPVAFRLFYCRAGRRGARGENGREDQTAQNGTKRGW